MFMFTRNRVSVCRIEITGGPPRRVIVIYSIYSSRLASYWMYQLVYPTSILYPRYRSKFTTTLRVQFHVYALLRIKLCLLVQYAQSRGERPNTAVPHCYTVETRHWDRATHRA